MVRASYVVCFATFEKALAWDPYVAWSIVLKCKIYPQCLALDLGQFLLYYGYLV